MNGLLEKLCAVRTMSILTLMIAMLAISGCKKDGDSTDPDPSDASDVTTTTDPSDASDDTDASDSSDASDPSDATDPTDATDPSDSTDATDATDATDQSDPSDIGPTLGIKSVPPFSANIGEKFQYRPLLDQDGAVWFSPGESAVQRKRNLGLGAGRRKFRFDC